MSLKQLVNNSELYLDFTIEIKSRIRVAQSSLEQVTNVEDIYRKQGEIAALRRLLLLRDQVNQGPQHG
jgi:hypothetical protein